MVNKWNFLEKMAGGLGFAEKENHSDICVYYMPRANNQAYLTRK